MESAAIRAETPLSALSLAGALLLTELATLGFFGTGALASFTGDAGLLSAAAGGVAGVLASGVVAAASCATGAGGGWVAGGAGTLLATTGLGCAGCEPDEA